MKAPVAVIIFNRPDNVSKLIECLKEERDRELFVISDGARKNVPDEAEKVKVCRDMFKTWPSNTYFNLADSNMGCKDRVSSGLDWVFEHTDRAIILEDDCHPHHDFFRFADELLERLENDSRVMSICGTNLFSLGDNFNWSYCFSKYQNCWGWATWKRSWELYDHNLSGLPAAKQTDFLREYLGSRRAAMYWHYILDKVREGQINSWAYIWSFSSFLCRGLHVIPQYNLVENVGFGAEATHTEKVPPYLMANTNSITFPLKHPPIVSSLDRYDKTIEDTIFSKSIYQRILWCLRKVFKYS